MIDKNQNIFITDIQEFNVLTANFIKQKLEKITKNGPINIALSGGSTPLPILNILKDFNLDWNNFNFFLVDERVVNISSNQSNYKNINDVFFQYISSKNYPILQENMSLDEMVSVYKKQIQEHVDFLKPNQPKFDMIILGMGEDGHTASLFPNTIALNEFDEFIVKNYVPQLNSHRITLSYPALLSCEQLIVLIKGAEKVKVFEEIINGNGNKYPMSKLLSSKLDWIVGK